jgi:hypothetical protein
LVPIAFSLGFPYQTCHLYHWIFPPSGANEETPFERSQINNLLSFCPSFLVSSDKELGCNPVLMCVCRYDDVSEKGSMGSEFSCKVAAVQI